MKPRTKLQAEVMDLHKRWIKNPKEHEPFVISNHKAYYTTHYKNLVCLECNHKWKPNKIWHEQVIGVECPSCKKKLKKISTENGGHACRIFTYAIAEVIQRFQVVRYFSCWKHMHKNKKPTYSFKNLFEEWTDHEKGKKVIIGRTMTYYGDGFNYSDYEIRGYGMPAWKSNPYDSFVSDINCPGAEFLPQFEKYGLTTFDHNCDYRKLIREIQLSPKIETLLKAKQKELLTYALHGDYNNKHSQYWPQLKIVLRNKYKIKDPGIYYDYLDLLRYFKKDIHSPVFICPKNLKKQHDYWMKKKRAILEREDRERERLAVIKRQQKLEKAIAEFQERFEKFFSLQFMDGELSIQVLKSIDEYKQEADELKHCLYTNEYYLKENSLILSARISGIRMETIEVSLKNFSIVQSRGLHNNPTVHHDKIISLVKKNMKKISAIATRHNETYAEAV